MYIHTYSITYYILYNPIILCISCIPILFLKLDYKLYIYIQYHTIYNIIWVCLKIGYIPNYSHLIGMMISKTIGSLGYNIFRQTQMKFLACRLHISMQLRLCCSRMGQGYGLSDEIGVATPCRMVELKIGLVILGTIMII